MKKIAEHIAGKLGGAQGGKVEVIEPSDIYRLMTRPRKSAPWCMPNSWARAAAASCWIAHMDTAHSPGMIKDQPRYRRRQGRHGLGIADDLSRAWP